MPPMLLLVLLLLLLFGLFSLLIGRAVVIAGWFLVSFIITVSITITGALLSVSSRAGAL